MDEYDIYLRGFVGPRAGAAETGLIRMFGLDAQRAREFVQSLPRVVKRHVPAEHAAHYERALQALGAEYELRRSPIRPQQIIAVVGGARSGGADPQQHGSTLTLTLAPPPPPAHAAPENAAPPAPPRRPPQFAATVVDTRPPHGLSQDAAPPVAPALAADPSTHARAWGDRAPASRAVAPTQGTWREAAPSLVEPAPPAPFSSPWPPRTPAAPPSNPAHADRIVDPAPPSPAPVPADRIYDPAPAFAPAPADRIYAPAPAFAPAPAPAAAAAPAPASPSARAAAPSAWPALDDLASSHHPPKARHAAWQPPALDLDPRQASWLVQGPRMYHEPDPLLAPAGAAPALDAARTGAPSAHPSAAWQQPFDVPESDGELDQLAPESARAAAGASAAPGSARAHGAHAVPRRSQHAPAAIGSPARSATMHYVGVSVGRDTSQDEPSAMLRFALRFGLGVSLFVILTTVRHCRTLDSDVQDALAAWGDQPAAEIDVRPRAPAQDGPVEYGPPALAWLDSDLHQVTSGDKDRVRSLVRRYKQAGAPEVYMGNVMRSGPMQIAGELIIELPADPDARKAVLAEHERTLQGSFGGFAPKVADPAGPVLRMTI